MKHDRRRVSDRRARIRRASASGRSAPLEETRVDSKDNQAQTDLRDRFGLTETEAVVVGALTEGLSYAEIAEKCHVSYHTIHSHVKRIHQKVRVPTTGRLLALIRGIPRPPG